MDVVFVSEEKERRPAAWLRRCLVCNREGLSLKKSQPVSGAARDNQWDLWSQICGLLEAIRRRLESHRPGGSDNGSGDGTRQADVPAEAALLHDRVLHPPRHLQSLRLSLPGALRHRPGLHHDFHAVRYEARRVRHHRRRVSER
jgi:hypothetical protein